MAKAKKRAAPKQAKRATGSKKKASPGKKKKAATPRAPRLRQPALDGVDLPKDRVLDSICVRLNDHRLTINESKAAEDQDKAKALKRMMDIGIDAYKAHGVELVHTSTDKLRVRLIDDDEGGADDAISGAQGDLGDVPDPTEEAGDVLDEAQ
jgi:hypothetical protein